MKGGKNGENNVINIQSRNASAKLIHMFPSHVPLLRLLTVPGIAAVSSSSTRTRIPLWLRKPTMIFGTPRRKDCIQNFINLRSKASISRSERGSTDVLSSTQLMPLSGTAGLMSQTVGRYLASIVSSAHGLTSIYFSAKNHGSLADSSPDYRAVLSVIVHYLVLTALNVIPGSSVPDVWQNR